jgi:hypothetical protein
MTLNGIITFIRLAGHLKGDILQPQPINHSDPSLAPIFLSESVATFLATALTIPLEVIPPTRRFPR